MSTSAKKGSDLLTAYLAGPPRRFQTTLATEVGVTQQTISRWAAGEDAPVTFEAQLQLERATGGAVPVEAWLSEEAATALRMRRQVA